MASKPTLNLDRDSQCSELLSLYAWEFAPLLEPRTMSWQRVTKLPTHETMRGKSQMAAYLDEVSYESNVELGETVGE